MKKSFAAIAVIVATAFMVAGPALADNKPEREPATKKRVDEPSGGSGGGRVTPPSPPRPSGDGTSGHKNPQGGGGKPSPEPATKVEISGNTPPKSGTYGPDGKVK